MQQHDDGTVTFAYNEGDTVQGRLVTEKGVIPLEFVVTEIKAGGVVAGSPLGDLDPADGWQFELVARDDPEWPDTLSDLAVWTIHDRTTPVRAAGPFDGCWRTVDRGQVILPETVLGWIPWHDYTPPPPEVIEVPVDHPDIPGPPPTEGASSSQEGP